MHEIRYLTPEGEIAVGKTAGYLTKRRGPVETATVYHDNGWVVRVARRSPKHAWKQVEILVGLPEGDA